MVTRPLNPAACVILVPAAQYIEPACERGLRQLEAAGYPVWRVFGYAAIDVARSHIATRALREGFDELMWIDADIAFDPAMIDRLRSHNLDLAAGLYAKKGTQSLACHLLPGDDCLTLGQQGGLVELLYVGCGFLYTRRPLYDAIQRAAELPLCNDRQGDGLVPYFQPLIVPDPAGPLYLGEDYAFCERARRAGHTIVADTTIRLYHLGMYPYAWEDAGAPQTRYATYEFHVRRPGAQERPVNG